MPVRWPLPLLIFLTVVSWPGMGHAGEQQAPSLEMLEFMADWQTSQGEWVDPTGFEESPELASANEEENDHEK